MLHKRLMYRFVGPVEHSDNPGAVIFTDQGRSRMKRYYGRELFPLQHSMEDMDTGG
ncbi:uncharacterized protein METZ01_LOCUS275850 [marine metagenome]|uniref:Uncharacterized protein n=1 Tax=marine metagenome TaxID=408172 RepID=A0A382KG01_9ZZZZ